ncbi:MAG: hemerythrin domain-containing protein [Candidatus Zixiibacteriota bacterium]
MSVLCQSLEAEHRVIERVLDALERAADSVTSGGAVDGDFFRRAIAFIREFADGIHHQKEESILFPRMEAAGVPREGGPIGVMLYEHDLGRGHVRAISESLDAAVRGDAGARQALTDAAHEYVALLRAHIHKEDAILFPMADRVMGESQQQVIRTQFAEAETSREAVTSLHRAWAEGLR